jgi:hypothetical protein
VRAVVLPAVVLLAALLPVACSRGKSAEPRQTAAVSTTPVAAVAAGPAAAGGAGTAPAGAGTAQTGSASNLSGALLGSGDLPGGWSATRFSLDAGSAQPCGEAIALMARALAQAEADFERGAAGPFVTHTVARYATGTGAVAMNDTAALLNRCTLWTGEHRGATLTFHAAPLAFPSLGEQSFAVRMQVDGIAATAGRVAGLFGGLLTAESHLVFVRRGDTAFLLTHSAAGVGDPSPDSRLTEQLARAADIRLTTLGGR